MEGACGVRLNADDDVSEIFKNGRASISLGYIGIHETINALFGGEHVYDNEQLRAKGIAIVERLRQAVDQWKEETGYGFSLYSTPSENLCDRFCRLDTAEFGVVPGVTDKGYYTNSFHLDVEKKVNPYDKIDFEAPYPPLANGGFICYGEYPNIQHNLKALEDVWDYSYQHVPYYPSIYEAIPEKRTPQPRGKNTLIDCFSRIRTFFLWCLDNKLTANRPFDKFPIEECKYGTPVYINLEERDRIFNADLSATPQLEIQRDIFIFQTLIGCRVSDLYRMTRLNIVNGAVEYIQKKTKEGNPVTVRVPLNDKAKEILERYKDHEGKLLPFISEQKYNEAIKKIFKLSGVDRIVTILDPLTRDEVKKPLYEVASSHLARRTFIGNIYKKVKDPNLVSALSGHKEGSKAFRRYRDIDEEMKKDLVKLLD